MDNRNLQLSRVLVSWLELVLMKLKKKSEYIQVRIILGIFPQDKISNQISNLPMHKHLHTYRCGTYTHMYTRFTCLKQVGQRELSYTYSYSRTAQQGTFCDTVLNKPKLKSPLLRPFVSTTHYQIQNVHLVVKYGMVVVAANGKFSFPYVLNLFSPSHTLGFSYVFVQSLSHV